MPRPANDLAALVAQLKARLERLAATARSEGHSAALAHLSAVLSGAAPVRRSPGRPRGSRNKPKAVVAKPKRRRKNPWANLSPVQKLARINAIRKGRGLPLKDKL